MRRPAKTYRVDWPRRARGEKTHRLRDRRRYLARISQLERRVADLERARRVQSVQAAQPPHYDAWLCIHRYEGAWNANTGNGYYGGLQMDLQFQRTYGAALLAAKGTADRWTPLEQMRVAENAYSKGRGFYPWPTTARLCGLL